MFHSNTCPFCGSEKQDILVAFNNTENTIRLFLDANGKAVEHLKAELETNFKEIVIPKLDKFIKHYERLYQNYKLLSNCKDINSSRLESILNELDIHFNSASVDVVKLNDFKMEYERVKGLLIQKMRPEEKKLESERVEIYKAIYDQYYQSQKPNHTSTEIEKKKLYIATIYNSESQRELQKLMKEQEIFEEKEALFLEKSENLTRSFSTLLDKSKKAYQDYQTELVNAIRLPVLIYSGKIIQNFPLGLGINANVSSNQIVFEPMDKESTDAINLLSTGQLNGLAIAIELAIRKVYGEKCKLDFFMIDDPLQSIDDISAISLVDLLSDFGITQTIVSTHEDRSANLLNYKFTHKGLIPKRLNMKNEYLKYSAEDQEQISE